LCFFFFFFLMKHKKTLFFSFESGEEKNSQPSYINSNNLKELNSPISNTKEKKNNSKED